MPFYGLWYLIDHFYDIIYFATKIKKDDLDALRDYAAGEYLTAMEDLELLDAEDETISKKLTRSQRNRQELEGIMTPLQN